MSWLALAFVICLECKVSVLWLKLFSQFSVVTSNCQMLLCKCEKVWKDTGSLCFWLHLIMYITYNPSYPFFLHADSTCSKFHSEGSPNVRTQTLLSKLYSFSEIVCIVIVSPQWWRMWVRSDSEYIQALHNTFKCSMLVNFPQVQAVCNVLISVECMYI